MRDSNRVICLVLLTLLAVVPTLAWHDFRDVMENFVVVTADEVNRDSTWLVPTMGGEVRLQKPPLAHWTTALGLELRDWGLDEELAARLPSFLMSLGAVPGVYCLGYLLFGRGAAFPSAVVLATSFFFLKYDRRASYDAQLLLFTTWGMVGLVWAVMGERWKGMLLAGVTVGLGFLTKGPPALLMTVAPVAVWGLLRWCGIGSGESLSAKRLLGPVVVGGMVFLLLGLGWFVYVGYLMPGAADVWQGQATLRNERQIEQISRLSGLVNLLALLVMATPWLGWFASGVWKLYSEERKRFGVEWIALLLVLVPGVLMAVFGLVRERYLFPCVVGAAVLAGSTLSTLRQRWRRDPVERILVELHWATLAAMGIGAGAMAALRGTPSSIMLGAATAALSLSVVFLCRWKDGQPSRTGYGAGEGGGILWGAVLVVLLAQGVFFWSDQFGQGGRSTAKIAARELSAPRPHATYFYLGPSNGMPLEFCYYLGQTVRLTSNTDHPFPSGTILIVEDLPSRKTNLPPGLLLVGQYTYRKRTWNFYEVIGPRGLLAQDIPQNPGL